MQSLALQTEFMEAQSGPAEWQRELACAVCDPAELCRLAGLSSTAAKAAMQAANGLPILVPRPYLARIRPGDADDPLLLQVLPRMAELDQTPGYAPDPLGENAALCGPGLLWKYQNRILILATPLCAVHCRFCFRRHFPFDKSPESPSKWDEVFRLLYAEPSIHELILSGGDPLMLSDDLLSQLVAKFAQISHLQRLRIHTRMPVVIPQRVCNELISWIKETRLSTIMVVHVNHPAEIDAEVAAGFGRLIDAGIPVLSQGVLLAGINDNLEVLAELYERLADLRVIPYYLHQLDPVAGAAHFEVPISKGKALIAGLRARLPGYAVPRYVREIRGGVAKEILS
ncbi:MAG: EF-P beta-lysylation protein EpmB [Thermoguttaceae bacterium]|jgi:EF-P beta-lysylation protein EpmB